MKSLIVISIVAVVTFFFLFGHDPQARKSTELPSYINSEQAKEKDLQELLTVWYDDEKKYEMMIDNFNKKGDKISAAGYQSKLTELKNRIDQVLPIMQKYD